LPAFTIGIDALEKYRNYRYSNNPR